MDVKLHDKLKSVFTFLLKYALTNMYSRANGH